MDKFKNEGDIPLDDEGDIDNFEEIIEKILEERKRKIEQMETIQ